MKVIPKTGNLTHGLNLYKKTMKKLIILILIFLLFACRKQEELPGSLEINLDWPIRGIEIEITVGLGYTAGDMITNNFFYSETYEINYPNLIVNPPIKFCKEGLDPGIYYFKVIEPEIKYIQWNGGMCQGGCTFIIDRFEYNSQVIIVSNRSTKVNVNVNSGEQHLEL
jgi:hypothetical protein